MYRHEIQHQKLFLKVLEKLSDHSVSINTLRHMWDSVQRDSWYRKVRGSEKFIDTFVAKYGEDFVYDVASIMIANQRILPPEKYYKIAENWEQYNELPVEWWIETI